jgi:oxygen-independent coproporphyrinogen-3 oxidase
MASLFMLKKAKDHEFFEGHPNNTTHEHLQKLMI